MCVRGYSIGKKVRRDDKGKKTEWVVEDKVRLKVGWRVGFEII